MRRVAIQTRSPSTVGRNRPSNVGESMSCSAESNMTSREMLTPEPLRRLPLPSMRTSRAMFDPGPIETPPRVRNLIPRSTGQVRSTSTLSRRRTKRKTYPRPPEQPVGHCKDQVASQALELGRHGSILPESRTECPLFLADVPPARAAVRGSEAHAPLPSVTGARRGGSANRRRSGRLRDRWVAAPWRQG